MGACTYLYVFFLYKRRALSLEFCIYQVAQVQLTEHSCISSRAVTVLIQLLQQCVQLHQRVEGSLVNLHSNNGVDDNTKNFKPALLLLLSFQLSLHFKIDFQKTAALKHKY